MELIIGLVIIALIFGVNARAKRTEKALNKLVRVLAEEGIIKLEE